MPALSPGDGRSEKSNVISENIESDNNEFDFGLLPHKIDFKSRFKKHSDYLLGKINATNNNNVMTKQNATIKNEPKIKKTSKKTNNTAIPKLKSQPILFFFFWFLVFWFCFVLVFCLFFFWFGLCMACLTKTKGQIKCVFRTQHNEEPNCKSK